jgi:hypothetical protein
MVGCVDGWLFCFRERTMNFMKLLIMGEREVVLMVTYFKQREMQSVCQCKSIFNYRLDGDD